MRYDTERTKLSMHTITEEEILAELANALGYNTDGDHSPFSLMFPIIMRDRESLGNDFEPYYAGLADHAGIDPERALECVLAITKRRA